MPLHWCGWTIICLATIAVGQEPAPPPSLPPPVGFEDEPAPPTGMDPEKPKPAVEKKGDEKPIPKPGKKTDPIDEPLPPLVETKPQEKAAEKSEKPPVQPLMDEPLPPVVESKPDQKQKDRAIEQTKEPLEAKKPRVEPTSVSADPLSAPETQAIKSRLPPSRQTRENWPEGNWPSNTPSLPPSKVKLEQPRPVTSVSRDVIQNAPSPIRSAEGLASSERGKPRNQEVRSEPVKMTAPPRTMTPLKPREALPSGHEPLARSKPLAERVSEPQGVLSESDATSSRAPTSQAKKTDVLSAKPKPTTSEELFELVVPTVPRYDVIQATGPGNRQGIQYEEGGFRRDDNIIRAGSRAAGQQVPQVRSYAVKIWSVDGWESYRELARLEYKDIRFADALAKFNRSPRSATESLAPGSKVRLPPRWVLDGSPADGTNLTRKPMLFPADANAQPATKVEGILPGDSIVASSESRNGKLVRANVPAEARARKANEEEGPIYTVDQPRTTLYMVAARTLGSGKRRREIFDLNRDRLVSMDEELRVGLKLRLPKEAKVPASK